MSCDEGLISVFCGYFSSVCCYIALLLRRPGFFLYIVLFSPFLYCVLFIHFAMNIHFSFSREPFPSPVVWSVMTGYLFLKLMPRPLLFFGVVTMIVLVRPLRWAEAAQRNG